VETSRPFYLPGNKHNTLLVPPQPNKQHSTFFSHGNNPPVRRAAFFNSPELKNAVVVADSAIYKNQLRSSGFRIPIGSRLALEEGVYVLSN
jgi:hypothetical protein